MLGPQGKNTTGDRNYLIADIVGKGHYVGVNYYVDNPSVMWYGEGDDMFFIDGEPWPASLHGTGTEDYFNTSWSPNALYQHPYFGYGRVPSGTGWLGRTHVYRFHMSDPVYFDKSLRFSIEHGHNDNLTLDLSSVAYWYQSRAAQAVPALPLARVAKADAADQRGGHPPLAGRVAQGQGIGRPAVGKREVGEAGPPVGPSEAVLLRVRRGRR